MHIHSFDHISILPYLSRKRMTVSLKTGYYFIFYCPPRHITMYIAALERPHRYDKSGHNFIMCKMS